MYLIQIEVEEEESFLLGKRYLLGNKVFCENKKHARRFETMQKAKDHVEEWGLGYHHPNLKIVGDSEEN